MVYEHGISKGVFNVLPKNDFYGDSYNEYDLFGKNDDINTDVKTVMAHCVWSTATK